jgi:hypothetical protein
MRSDFQPDFGFQPILNHVALLVKSAEKTAEILRASQFVVGPQEKWEGEGTLEIYVGEESKRGRLLLMEPYKEGAYQRAMNRRGPGLHHIAIDVNDLEGYIESLSSAGWLLHPKSAQSIAKQRTAWFSSPGVPALFEIQQRENHSRNLSSESFIKQVAIPLGKDLLNAPVNANLGRDRSLDRLISVLGCVEVVASEKDHGHIRIGAVRFSLDDLIC